MVKTYGYKPTLKQRFKAFLIGAFGKTRSNIIFNAINYLVFFIFAFIMLYPFLYVVRESFESIELVDGVSTVTYSFAAYKVVLADDSIMRAFITTVVVMGIKVVLTLAVTFMMAYPLSKKNLRGRNAVLVILLITMLFSGGMIPSYILITRDLKWTNNYLVYIVPGLVEAYNVFVIKTYLQGIPESLEEAALLDGANSFQVFLRIYVPLSGPIMATIGLWVGVGIWNNWMTGVLYITDANKRLLQQILRDILIAASSTDVSGNGGNTDLIAMADNVKMAAIVVGILPIVVAYPFVQKYFVKGMLVGSVKG